MELWFSPRDIRFARDQVIWLIQQLELLSSGIWPRELPDTHYTDTGQSSLKDHAYFEAPCAFSAEITWRLQQTRKDGELLLAELTDKRHPVFYEHLPLGAKMALNYISGWRRRKQSYVNWKKERRWRQKHTKQYANIR